MPLVITDVSYSKNPVNVQELFTISIEVVDTDGEVEIHSGTFFSGGFAIRAGLTVDKSRNKVLYCGTFRSGQDIIF